MTGGQALKDINSFTKNISIGLHSYSEAAAVSIEQWADVIVDELCANIKTLSPKLTGAYQKNWTVTKKRYYPGKFEFIVHNKKEYQLTHLLENGHRSRNGNTVAARIHIKPFADRAVDEYKTQVRSILQNGGYRK